MKNEKIKMTFSEKVERDVEFTIPCYMMAWCNEKPWVIYKASGTVEKTVIEAVSFRDHAPEYRFECLGNAFKQGNTEATEMEWLDAIQSVINHLTNEVELACKVETV